MTSAYPKSSFSRSSVRDGQGAVVSNAHELSLARPVFRNLEFHAWFRAFAPPHQLRKSHRHSLAITPRVVDVLVRRHS
jgi:hypothetical protein